MKRTLKVGTRGSALALWQTRWVCDLIRAVDASVAFEEVVIRTHGDDKSVKLFDARWPVGGFVGAIERALLDGAIDLAVHSYKDLPTQGTVGLTVAAVPEREAAHDVLLTRERVALDALPSGIRIGTSSPRRAAQMRLAGPVEIVAVRGNVPTRVGLLAGGAVDGVVLAAAGLKRLGIEHPHWIDLPVDRFVPAPAQGACAVQTRVGDGVVEVVKRIEHESSRLVVECERAFLAETAAGCHTPVGALARLSGEVIRLHGQLFSDDGARMVEGYEEGRDGVAVGRALAQRLVL